MNLTQAGEAPELNYISILTPLTSGAFPPHSYLLPSVSPAARRPLCEENTIMTMDMGGLGRRWQRIEQDRGPERNKRHRGPESTKNQRASIDCSAPRAQRRSGKELELHNRTYHESPRSFLAGVAIFPLNGNNGFTDSEAGTLRQEL